MPVHVSKEGQDLISKMICVDPNKRITAQQAAKHPWIAASEGKDNSIT